MINAESLDAVAAAQLDERFIRPLYTDYGFAQIPQTVLHCLGASERKGVPFGAQDDLYRQYDTVILLLVDAFGWRFFERYADRAPFLKRFVDHGMVAKLTSQFPSTTAAHVTAIHTGLPVGQSGVFEWFYYEPVLDALIAPLLFSFAGDEHRNTLKGAGADPAALYPAQTVYNELKQHEIDSYVFQHSLFAHSPYTGQVTRGAQIKGFRTLPEAIVNLTQQVERQQRRSYYYLYTESVRHNLPYLRPGFGAAGGRDRGAAAHARACVASGAGAHQGPHAAAHDRRPWPDCDRSGDDDLFEPPVPADRALVQGDPLRPAASAGGVEPRYVFVRQG